MATRLARGLQHSALPAPPTHVGRCTTRRHGSHYTKCQALKPAAAEQPAAVARRTWLAAGAVLTVAPLLQAVRPGPAAAEAASISILDDAPGSGAAEARNGDLVLLHYVGKTADGQLFDSTLGGAMYRDGGKGALRPVILLLGGSPVPGICAGLLQGIQGMRVGGKRTITVPASLGFGSEPVLGPYGAVPGNSTLVYELQLLRLSRRGPDALMSGVSQCGGGFVNERTTGCAEIQPAEFL